MRNNSLKNVIRFKLAEAFAEAREALSVRVSDEVLERSTLEWSLPSDRPLPVVFMDFPLRKLLTANFDELFDTAGVGPKKIATLIQIMRRAAGLEETKLLAPEELASDAEPLQRGMIDDDQVDLREQYRLVREQLLRDGSDWVLHRRVDFWVLPSDRRVPRCVLDHSVGQLLSSSFDEIAAMPGVGRKKFAILLNVLTRARDAASERASLIAPATPARPQASSLPSRAESLPTWETTDETAWNTWRTLVFDLGIEHEFLGRYARTLRSLARPLWRTPLENFASLTLAELAADSNLTSKQGRDVLEVFADLHAVVRQLGQQPAHLSMCVVPRLCGHLNAWAALACRNPNRLTLQEVESELVEPLWTQLQIDLGQRAIHLRTLWNQIDFGLERSLAEVPWQEEIEACSPFLLAEARVAIGVRWREGEAWLRQWREHARETRLSSGASRAIDFLGELLFPSSAFANPRAPARDRCPPANRESIPWASGHRGPRAPILVANPHSKQIGASRTIGPANVMHADPC